MGAIRDAVAAMQEQGRLEHPQVSPEVDALVRDVIAQVADKWTMLILEALEEHGTLRFTQIGRIVGGISQKMLTKTVRQMECDGLITRKVHPVIPPHVDYTQTELGRELTAAFCGVWVWAETYYAQVEAARAAFRAREGR
ncbi:transcriptional regulator, HxlR family [Bosea lathyri]|uniref:Transcriptional regulator, HxlR family n=2 Tax=Bosea lathyri TaxID=1036778 RepID=A0A1H5X8E5_9HYPH|nr:transcriptional regulator, HxlR family [Bosea lathyri]